MHQGSCLLEFSLSYLHQGSILKVSQHILIFQLVLGKFSENKSEADKEN